MRRTMSDLSAAVVIIIASLVMISLIPGAGAAVPLTGSAGVSLPKAGFSPVYFTTPSIYATSIPKSPVLSPGNTPSLISFGTGMTIPIATGQGSPDGITSSQGGSSQLAGLFSVAMHNYYVNPPKPITDASPSVFLISSPGSDATWDALFNPPVYHGCGCG